MLGAVATLLLSMAAPLRAQIVRSFTQRYSTNASGTVQIVGNALLTCPASATCTSAQAGTGGTLDNNSFSMVDIDIDADATTQNSSSATFTLPPGGAVLFAGLYYGARSNAAARNTVRFRTPALAGYTTVTATQVDANNPAYQGFADVTSLVQAGGTGTYTVANVQRTLGTDQYAGWALVIVVRDPAELRRNLVVFDGYGTVQSSASTINIPVSGFLTPSSGAVNAQLGVVAYEGDLGQTGDVLRLNGTGLSDAVNPANNVFNSSISRLGTRLTAKSPNYVNQIGFDADVINASGILPNGSSSATITLTTGGETYYPGVVTLATQLYVPDLTTTFTKTVTDVNGGQVQRGDTLDYLVSFTNTGQDTALAVVVTDTIPTGSTFVPGSITYVTSVPGGPPTGAKTDAAGDDAANYEPGANRLIARLGIAASAVAGGRLGPGQGSSFRFRVVVNAGVATGATVSNQAGIDYTGQTLGDVFNGKSDGDNVTPGIQPTVVTVAAGADVQVGKTGPATGTLAVPLNYTVTVSNNGPDAATGVVVRDTLPASFSFVSATGGGTVSGNVVTWPAIASLANGASQVFTVTATPTAIGSFTDIAAATATTFDGTPTNNNGSAAGARVTTVISNSADVTITKTGAATVNAGDALAYTVTVANAGPGSAATVVVTDTLPAGVTFVSASGGGTLSGNVVTWPAIAALANGASQAFTVSVMAPVTGTLLNIAAATATTPDGTPGNNNGSAPANRVTTTVVEQADVAVTKTGPATVTAGQPVTYSLTASNAGPSAAAAVVLSDTLPTGVTFVSATGGGTLSGNVVTWPAIASLASGASQGFSVTVTAPGTGTLLDIAAGVSTTADPNPANNNGSLPAARVTTTVLEQADLAVTKSGPVTAPAASTQSYALTVSNAGPSAATGVVVTDTLPASVTFVSATGGGTVSGRVVTWPAIASLAAGASANYTVTVTMPATAQTVINLAAAASPTADSDPTNNNGSAAASRVSTTVTASADLRTTKVGPATVNAGQSVSYTVSVVNDGPTAAASVVLTDTLPAAATFVSATGGGVRVGNVVTWPAIGSLANGASQSFTVVVTAPVTGSLLNLASATSATPDPDPTNNNGSAAGSRVVTSVVEQADLAVTKSGPATVAAGASFSYTVTVSNAGPSAAAAVVVSDTLPATATFVSATGGGILGAGNVVTWPTIASLASGASQVYAVTVTAPGTGPLLNIAAGTSTTPDPVPGNNNGSAPAARVTTAVTALADVQVTKVGPASVAAGQTFSYTVTVTNAGPSVAASVVVRDSLPAAGTFVSVTGSGTRVGRLITWPTIASLAPGGSQAFTVTWTAPVNPAVPLTLTNLAYSTSTTPDPAPGNNSNTNAAAIVNTAVIATADLATTKTGPASVNAMTNYTYVITTRNNGPSRATSVTIVDTLPPTVTFVSATGGGVLGAGNVVTWPVIAGINSGAQVTRNVTVRSPGGGTLLNIAASSSATSDPNRADNDGSDPAARVSTVVNGADVATTKTGPATVNGGANYSYVLSIHNNGPGTATGVLVTDTLPAGATFVSATNGGVLGAGNVVTWPVITTLANAATTTRSVTVTAAPSGTLVNIAASTATSDDPVPGNNDGSAPAARVTTTVNGADVVTTKTGPATANGGASITYTLTVRNAGPGAATGIVPIDTLPATVTFVSASNGGVLGAGNVVTWPAIATLGNGASTTRTVTVATPATGPLLNIAASTSTSVDPTAANNDGSAAAARVTTLIRAADVATTKTGPATVSGGANYTYVITTRNLGPDPASSVVVVDTLPATVTFVSATNGGVLGAGNVVTWPAIGTLANGASATRRVTVTAPAVGTLLNIAASTAATGDPDPTNNDGSPAAARVTTLVTAADLVTTKTGPAAVNPGASISYTITTRNLGPDAAPTVVIRDTLPATVTFVSATNGGVLGAGNVVTWPAIGSLANGASVTRTVTVTAPASGTLLNIAASSSATTDPNPGSNNGSLPAARVTTTVNATDVVMTKTGPATATIGSNITYTLTVRNAGPANALGVVAVDTLPAGFAFVSATGGGSASGNVVTWPAIATLATGASQGYSVTVAVPVAGSFTNIAASTAATGDLNPGNNDGSLPAARVTTVVLDQADVVTTKAGPATVNAGQPVTYTITVANSGPTSAASVVVTDTLPAAAAFVSATGGGTLSGNVVTWPAIASLASGANQVYSVTVTAPASGSLLDIAASTSTTPDPVPANNNGSLPAARVTTTVVEQADVAATKTGPASVTAGSTYSYAINVSNAGPSAAAGVVVTDTLPAGVTFVSATGGGASSGGVVTWPAIPSLANGSSQSWTVSVTAPASGTLTNVVASASTTADPDPANNDGSQPGARVTTTVLEQADVAVTKTGPATANAGQNLTYALMLSNAGPSAAAAVVLSDTLPAGVTFVSATGGGTLSGSVVTWPAIASLASGAGQAYSVTVTAPASGVLTNIAASTSSTADPNPTNNDGSSAASRVVTTIVEVADVATTKTGPATAVAATDFSYDITVLNAGPSAAAGVVVTDTLPVGATFVSATGGGTLSGNVVTWPAIASLANGASQSYTVTVTAPAAGTLLNIAASAASTLDADPSNNDGSSAAARVTTVVQERADVVTTKTGPPNVSAASQFSYTINLRNQGPSDAAGVLVSDTLPAAVTFVSATGGGTLSGGVVTWPAAALAAGAFRSFDVTVTAPASGTFTNIVASTATTPDPISTNNDGSDPASRVTTTVSELADVATSKTGPARVNAGSVVDYTISVTNLGPSAAAGVVVTDPVPAGATFVSASGGGAVNGGAVMWPLIPSLAAGQTVTYTLQVRAPMTGTLTNVVASSATTPDPVPGNNDGSLPAAQVLTTVEPVDLAVTKTSLPEFRIGTIGSYTLAVQNVGLAPSVGTITVVDTLPASLRFSSADGPGWSCSASGSIVTCMAAGPLAAGGTSTIQLNVDVLPSAAPSVTNSVAVTTLGDTATGGNNASSVATVVRAQSPLVAQKAAGATTVEIGDVVDYTLTVENQSAQPVPAVVFNDQLPLGFAYQPGTVRVNGLTVPDPAGAPGPALGFAVGTVPGNAIVTVTYRVYVGPGAAAGDGLNRAQAQSTTSGVTSNLATAKVEVTGGVFSDRGIIAGKIFVDCACDPNGVQGPRDIGVPGVRIMLEDGTSTVTDVEGKFNFYGLAPRMHVLKVDVTTLPPGAKLAAISSRNAGDGWTRFVDLRNSEFARGDFAEVSHDPAVLAAVVARRNRGEVVAAIADSTPMVMAGDSLAPSGETVPGAAFQPLIGGLSSPVTAEGAASPVLRLPQANQPERLARPTDSRIEMMVPAQGIPADGQTSVPVRVKIVAADGSVITTPATVTLETTLGRWLVEDLDATQPGVQTQLRGGQGEFMLAASPREGVGEIRATSGALVQTGRVAFLPVERPLTAVGILEGRIDLRSLSKGALVPTTPQDGFEQELKDISISGDSGLNQAGARAALYLQGKVKGSYLLTLAFDTEQDPGKRYMQDIQPDEFYPVYGDASVKDYGAQSYDRLYVRIDKDRNYFLYGDYQTPSPSQARQLGGYLRSLTGAVQHFENRTVQANAFAAHTRITQVVDELRGMGISGPYQLSQGNARINSERIEVLTRDRNQPERVLKIVPLTRFTDYTVEPFTGRILLRQPLPSLDAELNPVSLRITYEVEPQDAPQAWTYGADAQVRVSSFAEVGGAVIQDANPYNGRQIYTANGSARLGRNTQLVMEGAITNTDSLGEGSAGRFELRHQSGGFGANVFGAMSSTDFSNPSATFGAGQLQFGARASMQIDQKNGVRAEALLSEDRVNGGRRKGALVAYERTISRLFRAEVGYRWAEETATPVDTATAITPGATPNETNAIGVKLTGLLPNRRGSASIDFEQDVVNTDQRRAALAAEYWVFPRLRLYGRYELLSSFAGPYALNGAQRLAQAVVGFDLAYFRDGQFFSEYRARDAFSGREAEATIGLRNRWQVAPGVRVDASFERVNPIKGADGAEATAVTAAVEYTRSPLWKGTLRAEYRNATSGDNFLATLGYARKLTRDWTFLGRGFWNALPDDQLRTRGQLGLAWRQTDQNEWNGLARVEHGVDRLRNGLNGELTSRQLDIASAQVNYQPILRLTLSAQYAAKWMRQDDAFQSKTATQLGQLRGVYDLDHNWDIGLQGSTMWGGAFRSVRYGVGGELGRRLINNLRLAAGYNLFGFRDNDLRETDYTLQGAYFRLDFKFDESILPGLRRTEETAP